MTERQPTVLIVEDEAIIAMEMEDALRDAGWTVLGPAGSLQRAEALLADHLPDAALLDINLRGQSTIALAETLRSRQVPVFFLTGYVEDNLPESLRDTPVLAKPVPPEEIASLLATLKPAAER